MKHNAFSKDAITLRVNIHSPEIFWVKLMALYTGDESDISVYAGSVDTGDALLVVLMHVCSEVLL